MGFSLLLNPVDAIVLDSSFTNEMSDPAMARKNMLQRYSTPRQAAKKKPRTDSSVLPIRTGALVRESDGERKRGGSWERKRTGRRGPRERELSLFSGFSLRKERVAQPGQHSDCTGSRVIAVLTP